MFGFKKRQELKPPPFDIYKVITSCIYEGTLKEIVKFDTCGLYNAANQGYAMIHYDNPQGIFIRPVSKEAAKNIVEKGEIYYKALLNHIISKYGMEEFWKNCGLCETGEIFENHLKELKEYTDVNGPILENVDLEWEKEILM